MKPKELYILFFIFFASLKISAQEILSSPETMSKLSKDSTVTEYYKNGKIREFISFKNGGLWNIERYEEDGSPHYTGDIKNGNGTFEDSYGKRPEWRCIGNYLNGKPEGNWKIYSDWKQKTLSYEFFYKNGYLISDIYYDKKGRKRMETTYNENKLPKKPNEKKLPPNFQYINEPINIKFYKKGKLTQETKIEYQKNKRPKQTVTMY